MAESAATWTMPRPGAWRTVSVLAFVYIMAVVDRVILQILIPGIKTSLLLSDTQVSLLLGFAFALCFALAGIPLGFAADRLNRRNLLIFGVAGWGLATIACGLTQNFWAFFVARMIVGACEAALAPAAISMVADLFPPAKRGKPTGVLMACSMFGGVLSNFIAAGFLAWFAHHPLPVVPGLGELAAWQVALFGAGAPCLIAVPLLLMVREPERERHSSVGGIAQVFDIKPYLSRHAVMFALLFTAFTCIALAGNGVGMWWPFVFMRTFGMSPAQTGVLLGLNSMVTGLAVALAGGWLGDWAARRNAATGRLKLLAGALTVQALALIPLAHPTSIVVITLALTVNVIATGFASTAAFSLLPGLVPPHWRGRLIAVYQFIGNLVGFGLGPTLVAMVTNGVLKDESRVADAMLIYGVPLLGLAAMLAALAVPRLRYMREREAF